MKIEFRVDGGPAIGMGHVYRCLALARALGGECRFMMRHDPASLAVARRAGMPVLLLPDEDPNLAAMQWIAAAGADTLIVDLYDLDRQEREAMTGLPCQTVTLCDLGEDDLPGRLVFNGFVGFGKNLERATRYGGTACLGTDYKLLRAAPPPPRAAPARASRLLIAPGGGDASGILPLTLRALRGIPGPLHLLLLEGPLVDPDDAAYAEARAALPHSFEQIHSDEPFDLMASADLAISAGGDMLYELALLGVPSLVLCHVVHQEVTARAFAQRGAAVALGQTKDATAGMVHVALAALIEDRARRQALSDAGRGLVDGGGVARVAARILETLNPTQGVSP